MATGANDIRSSENPTADNDDTIFAALQTQQSLVSSFETWLTQRIEADGDRSGIVSRVQKRVDNYRQWLIRSEATLSDMTEDNETWTMDARAQSGDDDRPVIVVTGPGSGDPIGIVAKDDPDMKYLMSDNYLGYMINICLAFANAQRTLRSLLQTTSELEQEESQLRQPPEDTVKTYIRRLRDYNDIKDIGQQLIGLIAENRGVPIRTLYENGEYGVSIPH